MTETGNKTGKREQDSDNENSTRARIASGEQEDSQRSNPETSSAVCTTVRERGLSVVWNGDLGTEISSGRLEQDLDRYATV